MILINIRAKEDLSSLLYNNNSEGPDPVYVTFSGIEEGKGWDNMTVMANGLLGGEYPKTFGHYHQDDYPTETYKVMHGDGLFMLQSKYKENGKVIWNKVSEVVIVKVGIDEEITISPKWGHSWSNVGNSPLIHIDNWKIGHKPEDYKPIKEYHGMAYYLINENGKAKHVPNPNYIDLPEPKYMTAEEFAKYYAENV